MAQNITLLGASYSAVPAVTLPKTGGGTAQFDDTTDADATASDIIQGKTAYVNGVRLTGTGSGGGGITVEALSVTQNGTYTAPTGKAYSPVTVNVSGGGGGGDAEDGIIEKTISGSYTNSRVTEVGNHAFDGCSYLTSVNFLNVTSIGSYAFSYCTMLATASFPNATRIGSSAFRGCEGLATASFPNVTSIGNQAFYGCSMLATASFPNATRIGTGAFYGCSMLATASFPNVTSIGNQAFSGCSKLMSLYILASSVATLGTGVFISTPMSLSSYTGSFGSIYVPASLVSSYKTATNWKSFSARITSYVE